MTSILQMRKLRFQAAQVVERGKGMGQHRGSVLLARDSAQHKFLFASTHPGSPWSSADLHQGGMI